jgi:hypothetical protein
MAELDKEAGCAKGNPLKWIPHLARDSPVISDQLHLRHLAVKHSSGIGPPPTHDIRALRLRHTHSLQTP